MPELTELVTQCRSRISCVRDQLAMGIDEIHHADRELRVAHHQLRYEQELHLRFLEALRVVDRHSASVGTDFGGIMSCALDAVAAYARRVDDLERRIAANAAQMDALRADLRTLEPFLPEQSNVVMIDCGEDMYGIEWHGSTLFVSSKFLSMSVG